MSVLTVIQSFCERTGITRPTSVIGVTDPQLMQIRALLDEEGNDLSMRGPWQAITYEASITTIANEDQGLITSFATNGFRNIKNGTFWDRSTGLPICVLDGVEWQWYKASARSSPRYKFRLRGNKLLVNPTPPAGSTWKFEYQSKNWLLDNDGVTYKQYITEDTDTILLPEDLVLAGLRWRWKKEKGFEYAEDKETYEMQVKDQVGYDGGKGTLSMSGTRTPRPGVMVPEGNGSLP